MNDPIKDELMALGDSCTCPVCGALCVKDGLVRFIGTVELRRPSYTVLHTGSHLICNACFLFQGRPVPRLDITQWVFPAVKNIPVTRPLEDLLAVQQMNGPVAETYQIPMQIVIAQQEPYRTGDLIQAGRLLQYPITTRITYTHVEKAEGHQWVRAVEVDA